MKDERRKTREKARWKREMWRKTQNYMANRIERSNRSAHLNRRACMWSSDYITTSTATAAYRNAVHTTLCVSLLTRCWHSTCTLMIRFCATFASSTSRSRTPFVSFNYVRFVEENVCICNGERLTHTLFGPEMFTYSHSVCWWWCIFSCELVASTSLVHFFETIRLNVCVWPSLSFHFSSNCHEKCIW